MSTNLPLGTYVQDGLRSGPLYSGTSLAVTPNAQGGVIGGSHSAYGPGILFSPLNTWNIMPFAPAAGSTITTNVVNTTAAAAIPVAMNLTLFADGQVTTRIVQNGQSYIQFDWPRVVTVNITGAVAGGRDVTIFGTDWYGIPLQQTYTVNAVAQYPAITKGGGTSGSLSVPAKAFYTVNRVYINGALGAGSSISLGAANIFGLPYYIVGMEDVVSIGWGAGLVQGQSELMSFANENP